MKLGFYFDNRDIAEIDMSMPKDGNPGIGGTQYCFIILMYYLKIHPRNFDIFLFTHSNSKFPNGVKTIIVEDIFQAIKTSSKMNIDIFIFRPDSKINVYETLNTNKLKSISWAHNFYRVDTANHISRCEYIKRNVFVGRQQYDRYIDHSIVKKSTYIFNMFKSNKNFSRNENIGQIVTYVGSLVSTKGFHVLAKQWKKIINKVPNAKLFVIGTGQVYSRNVKLGKYNIADELYEKQFMKYLTDRDGKIIKSVYFLGLLGQEKVNVYKESCVGVVNPTGSSETFGISAIEMEACGVPVVTINKNGFPDTVLNHITGLLINRKIDLASNIVRLLQDFNLNKYLGKNAVTFVSSEFSPERIVEQWVKVFDEVIFEKPADYIVPKGNWTNNFKWLRSLNRIIKFKLGVKWLPSILGYESIIYAVLKFIKKRLLHKT